jgi:two-component system chemotaxis response regulator CheB
MKPIRVLVVEDSLTVRKRLLEVFALDPGLEVVGEAADGKTATELCHRLRPDVVTLDMNMPVMDGLRATEYIMAYCPTPILVVSASTNRGELFRTYDALAAGALDVLEKPLGGEASEEWERRLVATVKLISRIKVITHPRARWSAPPLAPARRGSSPPPASLRCIAIGASTGGPAALAKILGALPADFPIPILLVIHIGTLFAPALAEWLDAQSNLDVRHAIAGEPLPCVGSGCVVMAPPDRHLVLAHGRLLLTRDPERHSCRPSVDTLFESLVQGTPNKTLACLLTGMGRDGAAGLLALRRAGAMTIAQDSQSSVVYGMPREAAALGAADQILSLDAIASTLVALKHQGERDA